MARKQTGRRGLAPPARRRASARGWLCRAARRSPCARRGAAREGSAIRSGSTAIGDGGRARGTRRSRARSGRTPPRSAGRGPASSSPPSTGRSRTPTPGVVQSWVARPWAACPDASTWRGARQGRGCRGRLRGAHARGPRRGHRPRARCSRSRELAEARTEDQIVAAGGARSELLFPARSFCVRLLGPEDVRVTNALRGRAAAPARPRGRPALKAVAVERTASRGRRSSRRGPRRPARRAALRGVRRGDGGAARGRGQLFGIVNPSTRAAARAIRSPTRRCSTRWRTTPRSA